MPLGRPVVVLGEGMGSYWRDLRGGEVFVLGWFVWVMASFWVMAFFGGEILGGERDVQVAVLCVGSIAGLHTNGVGVSV